MPRLSTLPSSPRRATRPCGPILWILAFTICVAGAAAMALAFQNSTEHDDTSPSGGEPVIGGPCEGCEAVFLGRPKELASTTRLAPVDEPGEPMVVQGVVRNRAGEPVAGVVVYAYQTNAEGIYPRGEGARGLVARHGRLRAWVQSDAEGRYRFDTIRPASYPGQRIPAHIHLHVIESGCCTYWIDDIEFTDDPLLDARAGRRGAARGGEGLVTPRRDEEGVWQVARDIVLGEAVPGYRG